MRKLLALSLVIPTLSLSAYPPCPYGHEGYYQGGGYYEDGPEYQGPGYGYEFRERDSEGRGFRRDERSDERSQFESQQQQRSQQNQSGDETQRIQSFNQHRTNAPVAQRESGMDQRGMQQQGGMQHMQQKGQSTQDATLKEKINDKLTNVWFSKAYENLDIQVSNNTVTIRGTVDTDKDKAEVERRVRSIPEVKDVRLQLTIKNSGGDTRKGHDQRSGSAPQSY